MLSEKILAIVLVGVDPVLWILIAMSVISFGVIVERLLVFLSIKSQTIFSQLESVCKKYNMPIGGHFPKLASGNQLNDKRSFYKSLFGFSLLSIFTLNEGFSQTTKKDTINYEIKNTETKNSKQSKTEQEITKGFVFDELGPLAGASITVKNTNLYTNTDFDGNFIFNKKLNVGDIIIVSYIGVKTKEYTISDLSKINISVESYFDGCIIMGEVGVKKVYKSKKTFFQKLKDIF